MMNNKIKLIVSIVVAVIVLGGIGYLFWSGAFNKSFQGSVPTGGEEKTITTSEGEQIQATVVAEGTSPINKETGEVINPSTGKAVDNAASPATPNAPQQSNPISKEAIPASAKEITATSGGFSPNSFEVQAGAPVSVSVTSADTFTYVFAFDDPSLSAVAVGIGPGETRVITFNAPSKAGEYVFYNNVGPRRPSQISGKMIVK